MVCCVRDCRCDGKVYFCSARCHEKHYDYPEYVHVWEKTETKVREVCIDRHRKKHDGPPPLEDVHTHKIVTHDDYSSSDSSSDEDEPATLEKLFYNLLPEEQQMVSACASNLEMPRGGKAKTSIGKKLNRLGFGHRGYVPGSFLWKGGWPYYWLNVGGRFYPWWFYVPDADLILARDSGLDFSRNGVNYGKVPKYAKNNAFPPGYPHDPNGYEKIPDYDKKLKAQ